MSYKIIDSLKFDLSSDQCLCYVLTLTSALGSYFARSVREAGSHNQAPDGVLDLKEGVVGSRGAAAHRYRHDKIYVNINFQR